MKNFDQTLVLRAVFLDRRQLVATRSECCTRGMFQRGDRGFGLFARVDQIFSQGADDAVAPGINLANPLRILARGLQYATGGRVDHRTDPARLGVERILAGHDSLLSGLPPVVPTLAFW